MGQGHGGTRIGGAERGRGRPSRITVVRWVGTCAAVGTYRDGSGHLQPFVVSQRNGTWGSAAEVSGLSTLDTGGAAILVSVSCAPPGYCAASGYYLDSSGHGQAYVVVGRNGHWGTATKVPGLRALEAVGSGVNSVSCASAGTCVAGGSYQHGTHAEQGFVASQT